MSTYNGFVFVLDEPERAQQIKDAFEHFGDFTDTISTPDWRPKTVEICFISFDGENLDFAALGKRGRRVATNKDQIRFSSPMDLNSLPFDEVQKAIGARFRTHFIYSSSGLGGRVPPKTWAALIRCIKELRPEVAGGLDRLDEIRRSGERNYSSPHFDVIAEEKDAFGLALSIFKLDRRRAMSHLPVVDEDHPAPFLQEIERAELREDTMVLHDHGVFGDWIPDKRYVVGAVEFRKGDRRLTVVNVNRTKIERTLGVDLIYYHHHFNSFVMVQYKRMTVENDLTHVYRPNSDASYGAEIKRMRAFQSGNAGKAGPANPPAFRLDSNPFYFKLCRPVTYNLSSTDLIKGMYLALDYWELLLSSPMVRGPKGGIAIRYKNVGRYINNSLFIQLVQDGWVGSREDVSAAIGKLVRSGLEGNRSIFLAVSEKADSAMGVDERDY